MKEQINNHGRRLVARQLERSVQRLIKAYKLKVVAVAGSVGKTTTKLAIARVLEEGFKGKVLVHPGNFNSEVSLPLSVFELPLPGNLSNPAAWTKTFWNIDQIIRSGKYPYKVLVLELGIDHVGEMASFRRYITPDIAVLTAIAPEHMEYLGDMATVAREEFMVIPGSKAAFINAEDDNISAEAKKYGGPVQTYGVEKGGVHFENVNRYKDLTLGGTLKLNDGEVAVQSKFIAKHSLAALSAAAAVGEEMGVEPEQIKAGLENFNPVSGRMRVFAGKQDSILIDDSYNSSPSATQAAVKTLLDLPGRHIAILGSMNELGDISPQAHRDLGKLASKADLLVTIGADAKKYLVAGAVQAGLSASKIHSFDSPYAAGKFVEQQLKAGDVVLAKGSQNGVFTEESVAILLAKPTDRNQLVRQSEYWRKVKSQQFEDAS
jgi:UDP-N-acetylmuramoyl-tripeptide--D-alanyl-D-alanine ligase